ncbi:hydroxymethylbilane synthase [Spiractinospora alimapuensis]|uniref:hydroxymethylbilane synthase n=1 Tax=Spiractinospora alimapuensis TaxID=2820884 RepID=UPI001EEA1592|nr:hydroxymethylbilane synthase [Spiractinospora alimapuensis]QVQ50617.1 hydroxymethylbilane synthase [Spiractinospora alimapuensis]
MRPLLLGTRRSTMATTQSQGVADQLSAATGRAVELVPTTSYGDVTRAQLTQLGGTGVFVAAIRDELLAGRVDFAVHSLKDLPTALVPELVLAAVPERDDPRDALCARDGARLADLPSGARVGTGSPRRVAQLAALRPDLSFVPIRGNAETRLGKVASGEVDAVVLAHAGLARIGRLDDVTDVLEVDDVLPAPGQGALAVEARDSDSVIDLLAAVDHAETRIAVHAERTVLAELEAGCAAPVGAYAVVSAGTLRLRAVVAATDGSEQIHDEAEVALPRVEAGAEPRDNPRDDAKQGAAGTADATALDTARRLGRDLALRMIGNGADRIVADARASE